MQARLTTIAFAGISLLSMICTGQALAAEKTGKGCVVQVTGAVTANWQGDWKQSDEEPSGNVGAASDYWLSDDDLQEYVEYSSAPGESAGKKLVQLMRRVPRVAVLLLNCVSSDGPGHVFIRPAAKSVYEDVPRKAWSYRIVPERTAIPGQFVASSLKVGKSNYRVTAGRLDIKKFNFDGVTGTFTLKATPMGSEDGDKAINVQGSFNFPCTGVGSRCKTR